MEILHKDLRGIGAQRYLRTLFPDGRENKSKLEKVTSITKTGTIK